MDQQLVVLVEQAAPSPRRRVEPNEWVLELPQAIEAEEVGGGAGVRPSPARRARVHVDALVVMRAHLRTREAVWVVMR